MSDSERAGRPNQKSRTRKDLLQAAARLMRQGRRPSLEEIAEEALVSRATAYRYFPNVEALLLDASLDIAIPSADELFADGTTRDPVARLRKVDTALHDMILANEAPLRMMLVHSLQRGIGNENDDVPRRQNRRTPLIEAALQPSEGEFEPAALDRLRKALALVIGTEAMVVFKDVLQLGDADARKVKDWAIKALVDAARRPAPRD
ncbi:TetR/AcrR family transcriptional regulator [Bosea sp. BK604]|uniref:TetR/AcrR family transcriptional regulator n=1 Tax=Bosea sp. BK604 TaxID=2512180 RepID=UPI00104B33E2|nr:TetR/AcrR family transcriptional regulator [Bosea sp. BK604]TCR63618.1 TetR family transcriptional regulator [Bosea sp. BK604]